MVFAFVVTWIAVYKGYDCEPTSEGISRATTATVVQSSLLVLALDFILTALSLQNNNTGFNLFINLHPKTYLVDQYPTTNALFFLTLYYQAQKTPYKIFSQNYKHLFAMDASF